MSDSSIQQDKELLRRELLTLQDADGNFIVKFFPTLAELMPLIEFIQARDKELARKARIEEVKHRYIKLILNDIDEFKWKEFAEKRIEEIKGDNNGNR